MGQVQSRHLDEAELEMTNSIDVHGRRLPRRFVVLLVTVGLLATMIIQSARAEAEDGTRDFMVYNYLPWPIVLVSYSTGNPYPEFVKPNNGPIKTTEKFTIGVRVEYSETNIRMNFDAIKPGGEHIPAGQVEVWCNYDRNQRKPFYSIAGYPGPERNTRPRMWGGPQSDTLYFID
jgi:hypothetical protein